MWDFYPSLGWMEIKKNVFGAQVYGHWYCYGSLKAGLGLKLSMETHACFLHKKGALLLHLRVCRYIC